MQPVRAVAWAGLLTLGLLVVPGPEPERGEQVVVATETRVADDLPTCPTDGGCGRAAFVDEDGNRIDDRLDEALAPEGEDLPVEVRVTFDRAASVALVEDLRERLGPFQVHEVWKGWDEGGMRATMRESQVRTLAGQDAVLQINGWLVRWV